MTKFSSSQNNNDNVVDQKHTQDHTWMDEMIGDSCDLTGRYCQGCGVAGVRYSVSYQDNILERFRVFHIIHIWWWGRGVIEQKNT